MRKALSAVFAALLSVSMVPAPALAADAAAPDGAASAASKQDPSAQEEGLIAEAPDAPESFVGALGEGEASIEGDEEEAHQQEEAVPEGLESGDTTDAEQANSSPAQQAIDEPEAFPAKGDSSGGQDPKQEADGLQAVEEAVSQGRALLSSAAANAPYDKENPNVAVKLGQYAPGSYTVTANLYVPAALNRFNSSVQAYTGNPDNPLGLVEDNDPNLVTGGIPTFHVENNATLEVGEDDSLVLTIPVRNPVFTVQAIGSGDGVKLVSATTRPGEYGPYGPNGTVVKVAHTSRINSVTLELTKDSGFTTDGSNGYTITGCSAYPTILDVDWKNQTLDLTVDFSTVAVKDTYVADPKVGELTYNGLSQGIEYDSERCTVENGTPEAVNAGEYSVTLKPKSGYTWLDGTAEPRTCAWSIAKAPLSKTYDVVVPCLSSAQDTIDSLPSAEKVNAGFVYEGFVGDDDESTVSGLQTQSFAGWHLGTLEYAALMPDLFPLSSCVPTKLGAELEGSNASTENYEVTTTVAAHVSMCAEQMPEAFDLVYNGRSQLGLRQADKTPFRSSPKPKIKATPWNDFSSGFFNGLQTRSYVDVGTYTALLSPSETWAYPDGYWVDGTSEPKEFRWDIAPATLVAAAKDVYVHEGEAPSLPVEVSGFVADESAGTAAGFHAPVASLPEGVTAASLEAGKTYEISVSGGSADNYTFAYRSGTLHVLAADVAAVPEVSSGLAYTGRAQQAVTAGSGCTLDGAVATDAGTYTATATLDEGFTAWADGDSSRSRTFEFTIAKAKLTASYIAEAVSRADMDNGKDWPLFRVRVEGFVNGERPENGTVAAYIAPELYEYVAEGAPKVKASDWKPDRIVSPSFIPQGGSAKNYEFADYQRDTLWMIGDSPGKYKAAFPNTNSQLVYNGSDQLGVIKRAGSTVVAGASATNAGVHKATVVLDDERTSWYKGYWHGENSKPDPTERIIQLQWSIAPAPLSAKAKDATLTYGDALHLEAEISGFVAGEGVDTASGYAAPTVALPAGVDAESLEPGRTYPLSVSGGSADNYRFDCYEGGTLTVLPKGEVADPAVKSGLTYNGIEQCAVQENDAWTLSGDVSAVDAGDYRTTVTLNAGYTWADGTAGKTKTFDWSIAKASLTATYAGETIVKGQRPALKADVTGFVGFDTPANALGYRAPTVKLPDGIASGSFEPGAVLDLAPQGGQAANYAFAYKGGKLKVGELVPGTYTVAANLSMPGEYNPVVKGLTVVANNPDNPFTDNRGNKPVLDGNDPSEVHDRVPSDMLRDNATLVVGADGAKTLVLPVKNPVFTVQTLGTCSSLGDVKVERTAPSDASAWSYGSYPTRISRMSVRLTDGLYAGTASYAFTGSVLYAVPLNLDIKPDGALALQLDVEYSSAKKVSDSTSVPEVGDDDPNVHPGGNAGGNPAGNPGGGTAGSSAGNPAGNPAGNAGGNTANGSNGGASATTGGAGTTGGASGSSGQNGAAAARLRAGTYTVTSNIWVSRESSGLPLSPHLTSSIFPPKDPAQNNATLQVSSSGRALLTVPISIQDRIMTVQSIAVSGYNVISSTSSGGNLTGITVDLGVLENPDAVITRSATVGITMGSLASTISGISGAQTWDATFEVNLTGVPTMSGAVLSGLTTASGQGAVPASVLAMLNGEGKAADEAAEAALAAAENKANAAKKASSRGSAEGSGLGAETLVDEMAHNPALSFGLGALCTLAVGGAVAGGAVAYRRRKASTSAK